jgi:hypothetical protein
VSTDECDPPGAKLRQLLSENQISSNVAEGLRLIVAFNKIRNSTDRRVIIELAERLAK